MMATDFTKTISTWCRPCKRATKWVPGRGGKFSRCSECDERYPCAHECKHLDCKMERDERKRGSR